jgi:hypothetical protein
VLFVFRFPAGVLVYWITTNFWTMGQQYIVRKRVGPRLAVAGGADIDGTAGGSSTKPKGSGPRSAPSDRKALPKAPSDIVKANGEKAASGGLSALLRGRSQPAQSADQADVATNGAGNGSSSIQDTKKQDAKPKSDSGPRSGASARTRAARSTSGKSSSASGKSSGGSGKTAGSAKGSSSSSDGGSSSREDGAKPPPPPRKRKKRSGRRR